MPLDGNSIAVNKYTISYHNLYTEFNPNRSINIENKGINSFVSLSMNVTPPICTKFTCVRPFFVKKFCTDFDISAKGLFPDTR